MITRLFLSYIVDEAKKLSPAQQVTMMVEFRSAFQLLNNKKKEIKQNSLLQIFASVLRSKVIPVFDQFPLDFFSRPLTEKQTVLKEKIPQSSVLDSALVHVLSFFTAEEIQKQLSCFLNTFSDYPHKLFVKSVRDIDSSTRADIRSHYKESFVTFKVEKNLLGGMQIYNQGKLSDSTWKGKVEALSRMLSK